MGNLNRATKPAASCSSVQARAYEQAFASARPMTPAERSSFLLWCRQQGITKVVAQMAKSVRIGKIKKGSRVTTAH